MKLIIKKPSYFSKEHELDSQIIKMTEEILNYFEFREYSENVNTLDIVPVVAPKEILDTGLWKEEVMYSKIIKRASILKHVNYEKYLTGSVEERKRLTVKCVLEAVEMIKSKKSTKFDVEQFKKDVLSFTGYTEKELEEV